MKIYKITQDQYKQLLQDGFITVSGKRYDYDSSAIYNITDIRTPEYTLDIDSSNNEIILYRDGETYSSADISQMSVAYAKDAKIAHGLSLSGDVPPLTGPDIVDNYAKKAHTHTFTGNQGDVSVSGSYIKTTGASASYTPAGSVSVTRSADVALNTATVTGINSVGTLPSLTASETAATGDIQYLKDVSINDGKTITYNSPTFGTTDIYSITGVGSLPSLASNTTAAGGISYITSLAKSGYTPAGSVSASFTGSASTGSVSLTAKGTVALTNGTAPSLTISSTTFSGANQYVSEISNTAAKANGTDTFIKTINGGSGSLTANATASGGISYIESVSKGSYTPAGNVSGTVAGKLLTLTFTGTATSSLVTGGTTKYLHHTHNGASAGTTGAAVTGVTGGTTTATFSYMRFDAGTTPKSSATFTGSESTALVSVTPIGKIDAKFTGTNSTAVVTGGTTNYLHFNQGSLPSRSASAIKAYTSVTSAGSATLGGSITINKTNNYLKFNAGSLPTKNSAQTFVTGVKTQPSFTAKFTGTAATINSTLTTANTAITSTGKFTPAGTIGVSEEN